MMEIITIVILSIFVVLLIFALWVNIKIQVELKFEINELYEVNESLNNEIKFQSKVNKTLRDGLDAITKKNCHVKDI